MFGGLNEWQVQCWQHGVVQYGGVGLICHCVISQHTLLWLWSVSWWFVSVAGRGVLQSFEAQSYASLDVGQI